MTSRRVAALLVAGGVTMLATSVAGTAASADDQSQLGFFDVTADAAGIGASFGDPASQPYPVAAGLLPNAVARLSAGPSGQAMASILWPGPLLGNAGSLANVVGTPLPPEVVSNANYPVVAQASAGGGGRDEHALGPMSARVDGSDSLASTAIDDVDVPDVVTAARVVTTSHSYLDDGKAVTVAESDLQGVVVAGIVKIAHVRTVARGTSDGVTATTAHDVALAGVTVADQAATIDRDGLHVGGGAVPLGAAAGGAKPALDAFGMTAFVTEPRSQESSGGNAALESGSVVFVWSPPGSGQYFTVVLGGSSVRVRATPGAAFAGVGDTFFSPAQPDTVLPTPSLSPPGETSLRASVEPTGATSAPRTGLSPLAAAAPIQSGAPLDVVSAISDRPPLGWVLIGMLGACLAGAGLHSFRRDALGAGLVGTACPLEKS